jgi:crossover junction endodeoxyribonuclease RuvC
LTALGLDQSLSCSGWVALTAEGVRECGTVTPQKGLLGAERLEWIYQRVQYIIECSEPSVIVLEGYSMGLSGGMVFQLGELGGVLRLLFHRASIPLLVIPPSSLKKFASNSGKAQKDEVRLGVYKQWGFEHHSNDVVDAYALARIGLAYLGEWEPEHQYQRELIAKLKEDAK